MVPSVFPIRQVGPVIRMVNFYSSFLVTTHVIRIQKNRDNEETKLVLAILEKENQQQSDYPNDTTMVTNYQKEKIT